MNGVKNIAYCLIIGLSMTCWGMEITDQKIATESAGGLASYIPYGLWSSKPSEKSEKPSSETTHGAQSVKKADPNSLATTLADYWRGTAENIKRECTKDKFLNSPENIGRVNTAIDFFIKNNQPEELVKLLNLLFEKKFELPEMTIINLYRYFDDETVRTKDRFTINAKTEFPKNFERISKDVKNMALQVKNPFKVLQESIEKGNTDQLKKAEITAQKLTSYSYLLASLNPIVYHTIEYTSDNLPEATNLTLLMSRYSAYYKKLLDSIHDVNLILDKMAELTLESDEPTENKPVENDDSTENKPTDIADVPTVYSNDNSETETEEE